MYSHGWFVLKPLPNGWNQYMLPPLSRSSSSAHRAALAAHRGYARRCRRRYCCVQVGPGRRRRVHGRPIYLYWFSRRRQQLTCCGRTHCNGRRQSELALVATEDCQSDHKYGSKASLVNHVLREPRPYNGVHKIYLLND